MFLEGFEEEVVPGFVKRLHTAAGARKALGPVEESELLYRIETDDEEDVMHPGMPGMS